MKKLNNKNCTQNCNKNSRTPPPTPEILNFRVLQLFHGGHQTCHFGWAFHPSALHSRRAAAWSESRRRQSGHGQSGEAIGRCGTWRRSNGYGYQVPHLEGSANIGNMYKLLTLPQTRISSWRVLSSFYHGYGRSIERPECPTMKEATNQVSPLSNSGNGKKQKFEAPQTASPSAKKYALAPRILPLPSLGLPKSIKT